MASDLLLHLAFDAPADKLVPDASGNGNNATLIDTAKIVSDPTFGHALECNARYSRANADYTWPPEKKAFTIAFWVNWNGKNALDPLWGLTEAGYVVLDPDGSARLCHLTTTTNHDGCDTARSAPNTIPRDTWTHVCFTGEPATIQDPPGGPSRSGARILQYVNGEPQGAPSLIPGELALTSWTKEPAAQNQNLRTGTPWDAEVHARIAHVRLYTRALGRAEILSVMSEDLGLGAGGAAAIEGSHPIEFRLGSREGQHVVYTRVPEQSLDVEIVNTSRGVLTIGAPASRVEPGAAPGRDTPFFYLAFRPGVIWAPEAIRIADENSPFRLARDPSPEGPLTGYYLFLKDGAKPLALDPWAHLTIRLSGVQIDGRGGSRSTRVELRYANLTSAGTRAPLSGRRMNYVAIMDEAPSQDPSSAPIRVGWKGTGTIRNDGSASRLTLLVHNQSGRALALDAATKITLHVPIDKRFGVAASAAELALGVSAAGFELDGGPVVGAASVTQTLKRATSAELAAGDAVEVAISLSCKAPSGPATFRVGYSNFGHLADTVALDAWRSPLTIREADPAAPDPASRGAALSVSGRTEYYSSPTEGKGGELVGHLGAGFADNLSLISKKDGGWLRLGAKNSRIAFWTKDEADNPQGGPPQVQIDEEGALRVGSVTWKDKDGRDRSDGLLRLDPGPTIGFRNAKGDEMGRLGSIPLWGDLALVSAKAEQTLRIGTNQGIITFFTEGNAWTGNGWEGSMVLDKDGNLHVRGNVYVYGTLHTRQTTDRATYHWCVLDGKGSAVDDSPFNMQRTYAVHDKQDAAAPTWSIWKGREK